MRRLNELGGEQKGGAGEGGEGGNDLELQHGYLDG